MENGVNKASGVDYMCVCVTAAQREMLIIGLQVA